MKEGLQSSNLKKILYYCSVCSDQQVAVGDAQGNLRILEIPRNFAIPLNNEKQLMNDFYDREYSCIQFNSLRKRVLKLQKMKTLLKLKKVKQVKLFQFFELQVIVKQRTI